MNQNFAFRSSWEELAPCTYKITMSVGGDTRGTFKQVDNQDQYQVLKNKKIENKIQCPEEKKSHLETFFPRIFTMD